MKKSKFIPLTITLPLLFIVSACNDAKISPAHQRAFLEAGEEADITLRDLEKGGVKVGNSCPTTGHPHVFVVPVEFRDYPADEIGKYYNSTTKTKNGVGYAYRDEESTAQGRGREEARKDIEKIYFGDAEQTQWHSLRSYYEESSYGKLHFEGVVADWYRPAVDFEHLDDWASAAQWAQGDAAASALANKLIKLYSDDSTQKFKELKDKDGRQMFNSGKEFLQYFDSDHDGYFDLIEIVYSAPFWATDVANEVYNKGINNDIFWAYCGSHPAETTPNPEKPVISKYAFFSYYTFVEAGKLVPWGDDEKQEPWTTDEISAGVPLDAHTLIHETGHALGLPDYYDTSYSGKNASGSVDMMDHNVGDHNSYSKTLLGWVNPIVVTGATSVTINSYTKTGDCIMVPYRGFYRDHKDHSNTAFIEYLAIELYNPTGVNKTDSEHSYCGNYPKCPSISGIKIYHVDSRLGVFNYNGNWKFQDFTTRIVGTGSLGKVDVASSNSNDNHVEDFWQLQYLSREEDSSVTLVSNESLFQEGDTFNSATSYTNFLMNEVYPDTEDQQIPFGYTIKIQSLTEDSATLLFEAC